MEEILIQCKMKNSHFPFAFIDKTSTKKLPSPEFLAMFTVVVTTNQRFTNEWKNGSFEDELQRKSRNDNQDCLGWRESLTMSEEACPLLKVYWLRMIVDEGHSMGRGKNNSSICFASWISAERRWAMTGTPTRQTMSQSGLANILALLRYLQHDFFSRRLDGDSTWQNMITRSWNQGQLASFFRLRSLLSLLMVRQTKLDIVELPPPKYCTTVLPMSHEEVTTYNTLVSAIQSNLLITSMSGKTSGLQDSLLHRSQSKHAKDALRNVRLVCSGGTRVIPTLSQQFRDEFMEQLSLYDPPKVRIDEIEQYLNRAVNEELTPCNCCGILLSTLLVFPCGHLVCTECTDNRSNTCIVCDSKFSIDEFQLLQPGMNYQWLDNIMEEERKKKLPASASRGAQVTRLGGSEFIAPLNPLRYRRQLSRLPRDGHMCDYDVLSTDGMCTICWKEHDFCNLMNEALQCYVCFRRAEACPRSESKSFYLIEKLCKLHAMQMKRQARGSSEAASLTVGEDVIPEEVRPLKAIVFSQFRKVLNLIGDRLLRRFGTACVADYWGNYREQELNKFIHQSECFCMILGKDGSEGLDLSFVTHIFFLEQAWDKSLEQQTVARAWRMGSKGTVDVETLIAEASVEESMRKLEQNATGHDGLGTDSNHLLSYHEARSGKQRSNYQQDKLHFLLKGLELIKNSFTLPLHGTKRALAPQISPCGVGHAPKKPKLTRVRFKLDT